MRVGGLIFEIIAQMPLLGTRQQIFITYYLTHENYLSLDKLSQSNTRDGRDLSEVTMINSKASETRETTTKEQNHARTTQRKKTTRESPLSGNPRTPTPQPTQAQSWSMGKSSKSTFGQRPTAMALSTFASPLSQDRRSRIPKTFSIVTLPCESQFQDNRE